MTNDSLQQLRSAEPESATVREAIGTLEPRAQRTYTPTQAVLAKSAGIYHWTPEGKRLFDFTSGVLVANLGHNPTRWLRRVQELLGWDKAAALQSNDYLPTVPLTSYNAITNVERLASERLISFLCSRPGGQRMEQVLWAASGSEAIQKALWAALARDPQRNLIVATRYGFHGKKGLAGATTGCESDPERDPRVRFGSFPMEECRDVSRRGDPFDPLPYQAELDALQRECGSRLCCLITEPYLGGGGSYHPPALYLQILQEYCRKHDLLFILDEVQSSFGRTGNAFAFETYGLEPDIVVLGKGLANGAPGAAAVGRKDVFGWLGFGEGSDTYSGNPLVCAAVVATLEQHAAGEVLANVRQLAPVIEAGLKNLQRYPFVKYVRGEEHGMVWGVEIGDHRGVSAHEMANRCVFAAYQGDGAEGVHLLGPLAKKVIRIAPPLVITRDEAVQALAILDRAFARVVTDSEGHSSP